MGKLPASMEGKMDKLHVSGDCRQGRKIEMPEILDDP